MMSAGNGYTSSVYYSSPLTYRNGSSGWDSGSSQYPAGGYGPEGSNYGYHSQDPQARTKEERSQRLARACGGPLTLTLALLFTMQVTLSIFKGLVIWGLIKNIPSIFICIGLWLVFANGRSKRPGTAGLSLINGGLITMLVIWILICSVVLILCLLGIAGTAFVTSRLNEGGEIVIGPVILAIISLVVMILGILYYHGLSASASSLNADIRSGRGQAKVSMFSTVILIFMAIIKLIEIFFSFAWARSIAVITAEGRDFLSELLKSPDVAQLDPMEQNVIKMLINFLVPTKAYITIAHSVISFITVIVAIILCFLVRSKIRQDYAGDSYNY